MPADNSDATGPATEHDTPPPRKRKSSEERNAETRAELEPLLDGERPMAVTIAAIVAMALAISNVVAYFAGAQPEADSSQAFAQLVIITGVLLAASIGMWLVRYWAVLGFQTLLALQILVLSVSCLVASSIVVVVIFVALIIASGTLFWYLVKAMARIQVPEGPEARKIREAQEAQDVEQQDE
ncbi:MAG: hypothetical protein JHC87_07280 [Thermoleophilaceae bacterium]|nr:hypothetical protein [Thermoleophilaceae bacterium]